MDEQRCEAPKLISRKASSEEDLLDMVERVQGDRMDEQRCEFPQDEEDGIAAISSSAGESASFLSRASAFGELQFEWRSAL